MSFSGSSDQHVHKQVRPQAVLSLLNQIWPMVVANRKLIFQVMLIPTVLSTLLHLLTGFISLQKVWLKNEMLSILLVFGLLVFILVLLLPLALSWMGAYALLNRSYFLTLFAEQPPLQFKVIFESIWQRKWSVLGMAIAQFALLWLMMLGVFIVLILGYLLIVQASLLGSALLASVTTPFLLPWVVGCFMVVIGFLLLMALLLLFAMSNSLILFPVFSLLNPESVQAESKSLFRYFQEAFSLVIPNMGRIIRFQIGFFVFNIVLSIVLMSPAILLIGFEMQRAGMVSSPSQAMPLYLQLGWNLWSGLVGMISFPVFMSGLTLLWYDCKVRSQGLDLRCWLHQLRGAAPA